MQVAHRALAAVAVVHVVVAHAPAAFACGGLFCSAQNPTPVDQSAERVIFVVAEGLVTAHVQIQYAGAPEAFAWVVPLPAVPEVAESSMAVFQALDGATALQVLVPPPINCGIGAPEGGGCGGPGCGSSEYLAAAPGPGPGPGPVTVYDRDYTDNYEFVVLGADRTADLVQWLRENQYSVSDNMTPVMDVYNGPGIVFLAVRLRAGRGISDIVPVRMSYEATMPSIPVRLTAVAAQPHMGILVFVLADRPWVPANFAWSAPATDDIVVDATGRTSYFDWVERHTEEAGGHYFAAEYVGSNPVQGLAVDGQRLDETFVSRFYTRMSPQHMTADPTFQAAERGDLSVSNLLDLSRHPSVVDCADPIAPPSPCAFNYCGAGAVCTVVDGAAACLCPSGQVAQSAQGPDGQPRVTCTLAVNPVGVTDAAAGAGTDRDPCRDFDCGTGACVLRGGFPTCQCAAGAVARVRDGAAVVCVTPPPDAPRFGPGGGPESRAGVTRALVGRRGGRLAGAAIGWLPVLLLLGALAGRRHRP